MAIDVTKIIYSTTLDLLKNLPNNTGSISVPNQSYTAGQYRTFTTTINLDRTDAFTTKRYNFSFSSANHFLNDTQVAVNANFDAQVRSTITGSTMTVACYVINQTAGTVSVPAFTLNITVQQFVGPFI
jgi:hypothetical protein